MNEIIFLFSLALIWIIFAVVQDFKSKEIANWLNFSLIAFAIGFRFFYSLFSLGNFNFFYQGLIGLGIFFVLGNIFYYGKLFAGGDAKLLIALGAVIPFSGNFYANFENFFLFLMIFLFVGALYSIIVSTRLCLKNLGKFRKEFTKQFKSNRKIVTLLLLLSIAFVLLSFLNFYIIFLGILTFISPYLYLFAKAVDEISMIKSIETSKLMEGDWLYKDVKVKNRIIKARWEGLRKEEITFLRKRYKKILIREGVVFTPVFLASFVIFFYLWSRGLRYSFW
ncbi:MAG: prepilin peptidase [Candidatus Pacearchaeota archaeon]|nr:prepilin peptidase [Candidatus Pacearchaeota archaeon]